MAVTKLPISVCLLTKNEARDLPEALRPLGFASEIIINDTGSTDMTVAIARQLGAKVLESGTLESFADERNKLLDAADNEWVLFLDADERVSAEFVTALQHFLAEPAEFVGARIRIENVFMGRQLHHGDGAQWYLRLGKKDAGRWQGRVHETWQLAGPLTRIAGPIAHYSHADIAEYLAKTDFYTDKDAVAYTGRPEKWINLLLYPIAKFVKVYLGQKGFLDGWPGFVYALLNARYSYTKRLKIYRATHRG